MPADAIVGYEALAHLVDGALCGIGAGGPRLVAGAGFLSRVLGSERSRLESDLAAELGERAPGLLAALSGDEGDESHVAVTSPEGAAPRRLSVRRTRAGDGEFLALVRDETVLRESLAKLGEAQSRDVENSARLQAAVLTERTRLSFDAIDYHTATVPSRLVDGDFIEALSLSPGSADFILGDVMGKGMDAAIVGAMVKLGFVRSLASSLFGSGSLPDPAAVCAAVESEVAPRLLERKSFVTITYARLDFERRALGFVDCGHTSIIQYCGRTGLCWRVKGRNMPMGFAARQDYRAFALPVDEGDCILLFTDGLSECRNRWGEALEEERIMYMLRTYSGLPASELAGVVLRIGFDYSASGFGDDVSLVCVKCVKAPQGLRERTMRASLSRSDLEGLGAVEEALASDLASWAPGLGDRGRSGLLLAFHEAAVNVAEHAFPPGGGPLTFRWRLAAGLLSIELSYAGPEYDWSSDAESPIARFAESGYGKAIIREATDSVLVARGHHGMKRLVMCKLVSSGGAR